MKRSIIFAIIVLLMAEALIVTAMLLIPFAIPLRVRILDIVVLSIVLWTFGYNLFRPIVNTTVKNPPEVGSMGIRWTGQFLYLALALGLGALGVIYDIPFIIQLLVQLLFVGILFLTYFFASRSVNVINKVAQHEDVVLAGRQQMRTAVKKIQDALAINSNIPNTVKEIVDELDEKLNYIAPCANPEAVEYETQFVQIADRVLSALSANYKINEVNIQENLVRLQRILEHRKNIRN